MSRTVVIVASAATAIVAFVVGFGLAIGSGDGEGSDVVVAAVATTTSVPPTTETGPTLPPETAPTTEPTETADTTSPPPETTVTSPPSSEAPVVTDPPVTAAPARLAAQYNRDSADRLVMEKGGTAQLTLTNVGGSLGQWLVQASGYVYVDGVSNGTLQPGQSVQVRLRGAPDVPPISPQGTIIVSGGSGGQLTLYVLVL
jgi:hypothetical protein